jgi:hypothetical protein
VIDAGLVLVCDLMNDGESDANEKRGMMEYVSDDGHCEGDDALCTSGRGVLVRALKELVLLN